MTDDEALGKHAKHLTTTAKVADSFEFIHDEVGYNYRLPNINAALGCAQLENLEKFIAAKRNLADRYSVALSAVSGVRFVKEPANARSNYWLNTLLLDSDHAGQGRGIIQLGSKSGLGMRSCWRLMHLLPMYLNLPQMDLSAAEDLSQRIINLPSGVPQ